MSLTFKSLAGLAVYTAPGSSHLVPVWTPQGYRNLELGALQTYINAPMMELIEDITGGGSGPSIWPAVRKITLTGPITGEVSLDGSADVSLTTALNLGADSIAQSSIIGLASDLNTINTNISGVQSALPNKQDKLNYTPVSLDATNLGRTSPTPPVGWGSAVASNWSNLPVGYAGFISSVVGTIGGAPSADYGHFFKMGRRDQLNGWAGLWVDNASPALYIGSTMDGSTFATWAKVWTNLTFDPTTKQNKLSGATTQVTLGNGTYRNLTDFALQNTTPIFDEVVAQRSTDHWGLVVRKDNSTNVGGVWTAGYSGSNPNISLVNMYGGAWHELSISANGSLVYHTAGVIQTVWHGGNFNPANYALTSHNHNGVYSPVGHTHTPETTISGKVKVWDDRAAAVPPGGSNDGHARFGFQIGQNIGLTTDNWFGTIQIDPWNDDSGGYSYQFAMNTTAGAGIRYRPGKRTGGWLANWFTIWDSSNLDPASPAPGGILTVGSSAATGMRFRYDGKASYANGSWDTLWTSGNLDPNAFVPKAQNPSAYADPNWLNSAHLTSVVTGGDALGGPTAYCTVWNMGMSSQRGFQIASFYGNTNRFWMRGQLDTAAAPGWSKPWVELYHTGNFSPASKLNDRPSLYSVAETTGDWNNATNNGWYMAAGAANAPSSDGAWYMCKVTMHNGAWVQQEAWCFTNGPSTVRYRRHKNAGAWTAWTTDQVFGNLTVNSINAGHDPGSGNSVGCSNWFRSLGNTGWYSTTHGGGIYMTDSTYVRVYNGKALAAADFVIDSDPRLKNEVGPLEFKTPLRPVLFRWKDTNRLDFGFMADEVEANYPEAVGRILCDHGAFKGQMIQQLSYQKLTAVLAAQNNLQQQQIDTLKEELQSLKTQFQQLLSLVTKQ